MKVSNYNELVGLLAGNIQDGGCTVTYSLYVGFGGAHRTRATQDWSTRPLSTCLAEMVAAYGSATRAVYHGGYCGRWALLQLQSGARICVPKHLERWDLPWSVYHGPWRREDGFIRLSISQRPPGIVVPSGITQDRE